MLVAFETKNYSRVVFFDDIAGVLLRMMGKSGDVPGAMMAPDIPDAITRLERGLQGNDSEQSVGDGGEDEDRDEPRVDLRTRAFPLLELLTTAKEHGDEVIWKRA